MSGVLLDGLAQLALLACGFAILTIVLVLGEAARMTWREWRDGRAEESACARLAHDQRVNRYERIVRDVIAERRR